MRAAPGIRDSEEGPVPYSGDKPLYHPLYPKSRAEETARQLQIQNQTLVFVPSPLFGYGLDVLLERLPAESRILCVEHDEDLMAVSAGHFPKRLAEDPRLAYVRAADIRQARVFAETRFGLYLFRRVVTAVLTRGYSLFPDFYRGLAGELLDMIQSYWRNRMTSLHMGRLWMGNLFTNLALLPACRPVTRARFTRPVVVTGAGESLELHLDFLRSRRGGFALVCVDTALPVLRKAGLTPDLLVAAEAQFANMYDFAGLDDWSVPVAADIVSYPGILRRFTGPRYIFLSRFADLAWFARAEAAGVLPPFIPALGSVGVMALYLAGRAAGEEFPVFLAGMDLRYQAGKPHARGSPSHTLFLANWSRLAFPRYLASWYGRPREKAPLAGGGAALVDAVLASYRNALRQLVLGRKNIFSLEGAGLDIGAAILRHEEAEALMEQSRGRAAADGNAAWKSEDTVEAAPWRPETVQAFLTLQCAKLDALAASPALEAETLRENDYLLLDFPENPPWPLADAGFIRRVRERAAWYASRIRTANQASQISPAKPGA
jgi:hypothetical protein